MTVKVPYGLDQCATEMIRVPGAIQPHGWLASLGAADRRLIAFSENWSALVGQDDPDGMPSRIEAALSGLAFDPDELIANDGPVSLGAWRIGAFELHVTVHRQGDVVNVELEASEPGDDGQNPIYGLTRRLLPLMQQVQSVEALCALAAAKMKRLTGFGRCLIHRFDEAGHGTVLSEVVDDGYDAYLGHCFPASDIPAQARALYCLNHFRLIADANYQPVPVRFTDPAQDAAQFDMSLIGLRSVSPVHLEYMRNMGTLSSASVSIMVRGALWGLISCHDHAPRRLRYQVRMACEHLGQLLSLQIEAKEDNARVAEQSELRQLTLNMVAHLADSDATLQRLVEEPGPLLRMARASGAAVLLNDRCWTVGDVPGDEAIQHIGQWLAGKINMVHHTDSLSVECPELASEVAVASGVLAISISQIHRHFIIWFRPEIAQTINWAGDPHKPQAVGDDGRLHPRRSFATWREEVRGKSLPWSPSEVGAALELRQALIAIVLKRAEEMAEVADELGRVNKELEAFSYTVSHDLRAPMRHIAGYVDLVLDIEGNLSDRARRYLGHVKDASAFAGQLVDALLDFSRMGRASLRRVDVDIAMLLSDLVNEFDAENPERHIEWDLQGPFPVLWGDAILIQVAVRNLVGNAVKYTRGKADARITLRGLSSPSGDGLQVSDNGVGFDMKYADKLFGVFQRLHRAEEFEGTGIGLASVRRIVERHGGHVTATGQLGQGATFSMLMPGKGTPIAEPISNP